MRTVKLDHTFFTGYRRNVVKPDEVLVSIDVPFTHQVRLVPRALIAGLLK